MSDNNKPSQPIPIQRHRSPSSSGSLSSSASDSEPLRTPVTPYSPSKVSIPSPGSSPILSYFLAQSPTSSKATTLPFRSKFSTTTAPVFEAEEGEPHAARHARRASTTVADRFTQQPPQTTLPDNRLDRGTGLLRRLSLSTAAPNLNRPGPPAPPNSAVSPTSPQSLPPFAEPSSKTKARRSNTLAAPRRAPSPMGERILKGHFDGFN
ncbi:hypothetical protein E1B28_011013 [Marasmius oreades]|uniref:Uncharacterized protein n=1 Tax=Marasmius oreades TaxID=181124 RepID=A0A9P7RTU8_9AGAR|nr:uncharacterized protein E1B28_011013 [Marasmius oreades]KAG7089318.1 hypothetical protein E1B28_011013 [Marasmius oreades]